MNISTWSIHHPVPPLALFLVFCVTGMFAFKQLPITQFPNVDIPIVVVTVTNTGAAPSELITQISKPVEDALASIVGVKHITTVASDSVSTTSVEFDLSTDTMQAVNDVKDAIANIRSSLPESISEPNIKKMDVSGMPIMNYAVTDETRSVEELSLFVSDVIAGELQTVKGVGEVTRAGGADRQIKVDIDPDRLLALGITAADVSHQLRANNIDLGGGRGDLGGQEYTIRTLGSAETVEILSNTPLALPNGQSIQLSDLGTVTDGPAETRTFALLNGEPVVSFSVMRASGASDVDAARGVKEALEAFSKKHPTVDIKNINDNTVFTEGRFKSSMDTLYEGAALAILVVLIFLGNWRATIITAVAIPLSIIPTFFVIHWLGFSLNTISLLGITLVTGILVDDAIVEIENIVRHIKMGKTAYEASMEAANEIGLTVIAISLTIVAVFAPVSFMGGIAGQYFKQFGLTVAIAVLFSLLVARIITPMMSAYILRDHIGETKKQEDGWLMRRYMAILRWTLEHRAITLVAGLFLFTASLFSATLLPTDFIPKSDEGRAMLSVELPPGSTLAENQHVSALMSKKIQQIEEVRSVYVKGGSGDVSKSEFTIDFGPKEERNFSTTELEVKVKELLRDVPDIKLYALNENGQRGISIIVLGEDEASTQLAAKQLVMALSKLPEVKDPTSTAALPKPEMRITPKPDLAAELGITTNTIASTISVATLGDSDTNLAKFNAGDRQLPIVVRLNETARKDIAQLSNLRVQGNSGQTVPLGTVADFSYHVGSTKLERYDRNSRASVEADLAPGVLLGPAMEAIYATDAANNMPNGTRIERGGDAEVMGEVFTSFGLAMGLGIMLVYVVLVVLFDSFISPMTILLSLPLSVGGAIFALFLFNKPISLPVVIGFLMLMGIVTKNAIMLVEFAIEGIANGMDRETAMLEAGHKRARPIVMTTIAMVAGMMPSALALGVGGEFRSPMAIAVIGGLILSTVLSLLFVPSLFSVINKLKVRSRQLLLKGLGNQPHT